MAPISFSDAEVKKTGTRTNTWLYPSQTEWHWVSLSKMGAWYLLIFVSFVTVSLVHRDTVRGRDPYR